MFLSEHDIRRRIQERSLGIEPFDESQLSGFAIDLRLGQQFRALPFVDLDRPEQALTNYTDVGLGDSFAVEPGGSLVGVSIEYVLFPADLAGFLFPRSSLERIGLTVSTGTIDPGFHGKIAVVIRNTTRLPARLYPGQSILRLCFGALSGPVTHASRGSRKPAGAAPSEAVDEEDEIQRLKNSLKGSMSDLRILKGLSERLTTALEADEANKGKLLEELMEEIFTGFAGFTVMKRNARLRAEEVDLIVKNNLDNGTLAYPRSFKPLWTSFPGNRRR